MSRDSETDDINEIVDRLRQGREQITEAWLEKVPKAYVNLGLEPTKITGSPDHAAQLLRMASVGGGMQLSQSVDLMCRALSALDAADRVEIKLRSRYDFVRGAVGWIRLALLGGTRLMARKLLCPHCGGDVWEPV